MFNLKKSRFIFVIILFLFLNIGVCHAEENYISTNLVDKGNNVNLNISVNSNLKLYGFLGTINYDENNLSLNGCYSNKYNVSFENNILLLEGIKGYKNTVIATCEFTVKGKIDANSFSIKDISLSNGKNVKYNSDNYVKVDNDYTEQDKEDEVEDEPIKNPGTFGRYIIIPVILIVITLGIIIIVNKKYKLFAYYVFLVLIATPIATYAIDLGGKNITEDNLKEIRNILLKKIEDTTNNKYDYDNDKKLTINDLIMGLFDFNNDEEESGKDEPGNQEPGKDEPGKDEPGNQEPGNDTTAPVINYCQTVIKDNETVFYVDSSDTDIAKYVVNNDPTLTFSNVSESLNGRFTVNKEIKGAKVTVYDTSNNSSSIDCWWFYEQVKPPENAIIKHKEETDTLKVAIRYNDTTGQDFYTTYIWVQDAYNQFKTEVPSNYGKDRHYPETLLENAVKKHNLQNKLAVAINASGYEGSGVYVNTPNMPYIVSNGVVIRDDTNRTDRPTPKYNTYGLTKAGLLKHYSYNDFSLPELANAIRNDGVNNTFGWVITSLVENGKRITTNSTAVTQQGICQINENNFVFVSFMWGSYVQLANYMIDLGCKTGFALDGGGSVQLIYKPSNGTPQRIITAFHRELPDIIYFHE